MQNLLLVLLMSFITSEQLMASTAKIEFIDIELNQAVQEILIGRQVAIQVSGLTSGETVTLKCGDGVYLSEATFRANQSGIVNLARQAPLFGSYEGIDADGMFWSRSAIAPIDTKPDPFACQAFENGTLIATALHKKFVAMPGSTNTRLLKSEVGFEALFSVPLGKGPFPTIFLVSGSEGGLDDYTPKYFASLGYATLSVAYHAMPGLPQELSQIPLEYFKTAINWLKIQKVVDSRRLGLYGISRGGELALLLASVYPEFKAVIANEPSGVVWSSIGPDMHTQKSSWTLNGKDLPAVPYTSEEPDKKTLPDGREIISYSKIFLAALKNESAVQAALIPVEKIKAPILILAGEADEIWPSCVLADFSIKRRAKFKMNDQDIYHCFKDAGHAIYVPGAPLMDLTFYHPRAQEYWHAGGSPAGNARAQRQGWDELLKFLDRHLAAHP